MRSSNKSWENPKRRVSVKKVSVYTAVTKRRSIRRFKQKPVPFKLLKKLINAARVAPSASNLQPLEYVVVDDRDVLTKVFATLKWAGYISPQGDPPEGEKPTAYVVVLVNRKISDSGYERDVGAAAENILLVALENGIGSCWIGNIDRNRLREILKIPRFLAIDSVIALGYGAERPRMEKMTGSIEYWKDQSGALHVPKRDLENILHRNKY